MKNAIKRLKIDTKEFIAREVGELTSYSDANIVLKSLSGITGFFRNQNDFLLFGEALKSNLTTPEEPNRREYGDFQTPSLLTDSICFYLSKEGISPNIMIEPNFGKGTFIISALEHFPELKVIYGIEIYEPYYWQAKFSILELFIEKRLLHKPQVSLHLADIFAFDLGIIRKAIVNDRILVLGNPPWITNSELGKLNSGNIPKKNNFRSLNGLDAITGKANFDIAEYIILMMLDSFSELDGHLAMLAKNSVIRNLVYDLARTKYAISEMSSLSIDAKKFFNASVDASLFRCKLGSHEYSYTCKESSLASPYIVKGEFGWFNDRFASDISLYKENQVYDEKCLYIWRQGVKHDCSKVMELSMVDDKYVNGFGDVLDLEKETIFGLIKSSDLNSLVIEKPKRYVIITQNNIGENTSGLQIKCPKLYQYLLKNKESFDRRKSSIYKNKPPFSIFGIGDYSFKPYKIAISGLYKRSSFSLVLPHGRKPLMLDDTCYFLRFDDISEAIFAWAVLNSRQIQAFLDSIVFKDVKRPYTKDILMRIGLFRVAEEFGYDDIVDFAEDIDERLIAYINNDKWDEFLLKLGTSELKGCQPLLFDTINSIG